MKDARYKRPPTKKEKKAIHDMILPTEVTRIGKFTGTGSRSEAPGVVGGGSRGGGMDGLGRSRVMHNGYKTSVCSDIKVVEMVEKYYPCN